MVKNFLAKICVVTTISATLRGFLLDQLVFLAKNGFDITIVCDTDDDLLHNCPQELKYVAVSMTRTASLFSTIQGIYQLYKLFKTNRFALVQYATPKASFSASIASWLAGTPVRLYCQWGIRYVAMTGLSRWFFKQAEKATCCFSTHISPDSYGNLDFSVAEGLYNKQKASVVSFGSANGVNLHKFNHSRCKAWRAEVRKELGIMESSFVYGWVGRVNRDKGVGELVSAFIRVLEQLPSDIHLLMIGDMEENHGLSDEIIDLIRSHCWIHYIGPRNGIERYYSAMDVLVAPSYREGFGIVAIEAQAMGVPVILSDIPGPREAVIDGKTGVLIPAREIDPLVHAMIKFKEDHCFRQSLGQEAVKFIANRFEQKVFWQKVLEHRKHLLAGI